ncbi:MAG: hypothetical protein L0271_02275 [Gemmatimonadetes bacterium]|nr:hypothetical protein [Gemmatimonadota bacterium]
MRRLLPAVFIASACATLGSGPDIEGGYERGLHALVSSDYVSAVRELDRVGTIRPGATLGQQALLLGAVAAMDPRNPDRDFGAAAAFSVRLRDVGGTWTTPAGETLRLISTELSYSSARIADAEAARDQAFAIATEQRTLLEQRYQALAAERDDLAKKAAALEQTLAEREKLLKDKEQELERIRKIVRG